LSSKVGYWLALLLLLMGAALRMTQFLTLPPGLTDAEITDVQLVESIRAGNIQAIYDLGTEGREGLYHAAVAAVTTLVGNGTFGYKILSFWVGMLALAVIYALGQRLFGSAVGLTALGLAATNFWLILLSRTVGREVILPFLVTLVMLALARAFSVYREGRSALPETTAFTLLGLAMGLGFYLHPTHFLVSLFALLFIIYLFRTRKTFPQQTVSFLLFGVLLTLTIGLLYLITSLRLPHLSGAVRVFDLNGLQSISPLTTMLNNLGGILFIGDSNPAHNLLARPLIDLISGFLALLGVAVAFTQRQQARYVLLLMALLCLLPVALLSPQSPDFQGWTALVPLLTLFFGIAASTLSRSLPPTLHRLVPVGVVALLAFNLYWVRQDFFIIWPQSDAVQLVYHARAGQIAHYLDQTAADIATVICDSQAPLHPTDTLSSSDLVLLMLNRKTAHLRYADCGTGMIFTNGGAQQQVIMPDPDTLTQMTPYLRNWLNQGEVLPDQPTNAIVVLEVAANLADTIGRFTTTAPAGYAPEARGGGLAVPPVRLEGNVAFLGYEPEPGNPYTPGGILTSITYWRVDGVVPPDLRFFTHVLTDAGAIPAAQNDTISVDISELENRDVFLQMTFVPLPMTMPEGSYDISVGAYTGTNNQRMAVLDENDAVRGDRLFLGQITVTRT
jgi:4-amino-4-deoxy-L-arabinose transferase-like glycosyltransferase